MCPSTALSVAQRRSIIITVPAPIMKVRARAPVRIYTRECVRAGVESARVRRLVAFGHRRRTGPDGKSDGTKGGFRNEGGFEAHTLCLGRAESRTKEKRVRSP